MTAVLPALAVMTLLVLLNGLFVAAEFAIVTAPHTRLAQRAAHGSRAARRALAVQRDPELQNRYLTTAQVGVTVASVALGMFGERTVAGWLSGPLAGLGHLAAPASHSIASAVSVALLTYYHVVVGEMIPKSVAIQTSEETALRAALPMQTLERAALPVVWLLYTLANGLTRLTGVPPADTASRLMTPEELELVVQESLRRGAIPAGEQLLIENIFDFGERTAEQVMTPRNRVRGLPIEATAEEVLEELCRSRLSRYPVYQGSLDRVMGVLHVKDLARHLAGGQAKFELGSLLRPALFVPASLPLEDTLARLRRRRSSVAMVFDEFGGTAGMITLEDLVEEVVGEIRDEFDQEVPPIQRLGPGLVRVRGDVILAELDQHFDLDLAHPGAETVAGLVMAELGRIAVPGDSVQYGGVRLEVETMDRLAVATVLVHLAGR
jgi:CBS domain containing-hemolysin-like protein